MTQKAKAVTPLMQQYNQIKAQYPDAVLLFRVGDFYETFGQDAVLASKTLDIVLTKRSNGSASEIPLAGFPHHSLQTYLPKLVKAGYRVAVCDQLEAPSKEKKIVARGVTELITPGVAFEEQVLSAKTNNYFAALHQEKEEVGLSLLDISTGEFILWQGNKSLLPKILESYTPKEIVVQRLQKIDFDNYQGAVFKLDDWAFQHTYAKELIEKQFQIKSLKGLGIQEIPLGIIAAGAALSYLKETHHSHLAHLKPPIRLHENDFVWMDSFTITNLELIQPSDSKGKSLMEVLDDTKTAFGGRTLRKWMVLPLKDLSKINQRQKVVSHLIGNEDLSEFLQENLSEVGDVERLLARASAFKITPKQLVWFAQSLLVINQVGKRLRTENNPQVFSPYLPDDSSEAVKLILDTMDPDPPHSLLKGGVIKKGFHQELDQLKDLRDHAKDYLEKLKDKEIENSGIQSLKVGFNSVFGYFFEVRNLHKDKVPTHWIRKQTLVSAERYISEELKDFETKILGAEDKIYQIESKLFEDLLLTLPTFFGVIQQNALKIGELDVLCGFARLSKERNYSRPTLVDQKKLSIKMGRHPVIENYLPSNLKYIPNDAFFDLNHQIAVITGPNMSGKSAYLRQVALIVLMAQMGCYVPAKEVEMGVFGRIFTRVGASDNLSQGESTFMVEMTETARILNYLSEDSLVILDEIGRGTSTFDGISIARAIAEFLHDSPFKPFTLFATHYHELNELESEFERIQNFHVKVEQIDGKIHFLRSLEKGGSEHSFGINVAKMAGLPGLAIQRAEVILSQMESLKNSEENTATKMPKKEVLSTSNQNDSALQLSFFQLDDPVLEQIREQILEIDINALTPVEALVKLNQIKAVLSGGKKI